MALQTDITKDVYGLQTTFKGCYFKVVRLVQFSKEEGCTFDVEVYRSKEHAGTGLNPVENLGVHFDYNPTCEAPILKECYNHLKTLNEFKTATDV